MMKIDFSSSDCNCFALRQAARSVTQIYERHLSPLGITSAQFIILVRLARESGCTIASLGETMVMERTSLVRALKPLQRDGLVLAETIAEGSRALTFVLTRRGETVLKRAVTAWAAAQKEFEANFGKDRAKALRSELFSLTSPAIV
jgi:DNA-binding MarR family transcriptional regulator